ESIFRSSSMPRGIGQRIDYIQQLENRSGPAVCHNQRHRVRMTRAYVDKVNVNAVDGSHELRQGVESRLRLSPVVIRLPVAHQLFHGRGLHALRLVLDRLAVGQACRREALAEVHQCCFRNLDLKGSDGLTRLGVARSSDQDEEEGSGTKAAPQVVSAIL